MSSETPRFEVVESEEGLELQWDVSNWETVVYLESSQDLGDWDLLLEITRQTDAAGKLSLEGLGEGTFYRLRTDEGWYFLSRPIKKSSVLFTQVPDANEQNVEAFGATGVFWGHMPSRELHVQENMDEWVEKVDGLRALGLDFIGRGEFDWGWAWFIDFEAEPEDHWVRDLDGEFVRYEFMGDLEYKGLRNYWVSHHSPRFLDFMKFQVDKLFEGPVTHVMFDSQTSGTRSVHMFGGDFSPYAMSGFREYMKERYWDSELAEMGIVDIDSFDYGEFLKARGMSRTTYESRMRRITGNIPLYEDFVYFNRKVVNEVMDEVFDYVEGKSPGIPIGSTTSLMEPRGFLFSERMTYLAGELFQQASSVVDGAPLRPILHYRAAEAIGMNLIFFPYPGEWARLVDENRTRQARLWIAQAHAMGAVFTIPKVVWVGGEMGVWNADSELYSDLYRFVGDHARLFDGYRPHARVGYVFPMLASMDAWGIDGTNTAHASMEFLVEENIPFEMIVFGDRDSDLAPSLETLERLEVVFVDGDASYLTDGQEHWLAENGPEMVRFGDRDELVSKLSSKVDVFVGGAAANDWISALPRVSDEAGAPFVVHLVNRVFEPAENRVESHENVRVEIGGGLFSEAISKVLLHRPGEDSEELVVEMTEGGDLVLQVAEIEAWAMLELVRSDSP
ncbi:hypothetical protein ACFFKJ_13160 [Pelagicoccus mobilis]